MKDMFYVVKALGKTEHIFMFPLCFDFSRMERKFPGVLVSCGVTNGVECRWGLTQKLETLRYEQDTDLLFAK